MAELYVQYEYWIAVFQLTLAMLGMGATLRLGDFREIALEPRAFATGSVTQLILVPLFVFLFIKLLGLPEGVAVGAALIAAIPGGTASNIFTFLARGNSALSIAITAVTTLLCLFSTPVILDLLIANYMPDDFAMPKWRIMKEIALTLLLPLAIGMLYLRVFPRTAPAFSSWCIRGSILGILMIVFGSIIAGRFNLPAYGSSNLFSMSLLIVMLFLLGWSAPRLLKLGPSDATAIEIEVGLRNVNLGVMIKASLFPAVAGVSDPLGDTVLVSLLIYGLFSLVAATILVVIRRRLHAA